MERQKINMFIRKGKKKETNVIQCVHVSSKLARQQGIKKGGKHLGKSKNANKWSSLCEERNQLLMQTNIKASSI